MISVGIDSHPCGFMENFWSSKLWCCFCFCVKLFLCQIVLSCLSVCVLLQVFSNCSCAVAAGLSSGNLTASVGHCPHRDDCDRVFPYFLALSVITSFIISLGGTPGYMVLIRSVTHTPIHKQEGMVIAVGKTAQRNLGLRLQQGTLKGKQSEAPFVPGSNMRPLSGSWPHSYCVLTGVDNQKTHCDLIVIVFFWPPLVVVKDASCTDILGVNKSKVYTFGQRHSCPGLLKKSHQPIELRTCF